MPVPIPNTRYTIGSGIGMFPEGGTVVLVLMQFKITEKLRELLPSAPDEELESALLEFEGLDSAANPLIRNSNASVAEKKTSVAENSSLAQIVQKIEKKLTSRRKKLKIDQDDLVIDAPTHR